MKKKRLILLSLMIIAVAAFAAGIVYVQKGNSILNTRNTSNTSNTNNENNTGSTNNENNTNSTINTQNTGDTSINGTQSSVSTVAAGNNGEDSLKIIVYNSHPYEKYKYGKTIAEVSKILDKNLNKNGLPSKFLNNSNTIVQQSYKYSRQLVMDNTRGYEGKILLDLHTGDKSQKSATDISIWIGKGNNNFAANRIFADILFKEIGDVDKSVTCEVREDKWVWNQDLSDKAVLIIIGDEDTAKDKVLKCVDVLTSALKNLAK